MANIPLALVGAVLGLWLAGQPLSVAALIGFITLAGISVRNGILKVSHYINLMRFEGERFDHDAAARLAGAPQPGADDRPGDGLCAGAAAVRGRAARHRNPAPGGRGDLCGLISSTLLDTFLTPAMFWLLNGNAEAF
jgi:HME family heavy-metal exporter